MVTSKQQCVCKACGADTEGTFTFTMYLVGGCDCYDRPPTAPVFRDWKTHLADCPARGTNIPVGRAVRRRA